MKRIGVYIDVSNLYYTIKMKYPDRKLDYSAYLAFINDIGYITIAKGYGASINRGADRFKKLLGHLGIEAVYKEPKEYYSKDGKVTRKADWDVGICIDAIKDSENLDIVVLGTADGDMVPLVEFLKGKGLDVVSIACDISRDLKDSVTSWIEIPESLLEVK